MSKRIVLDANILICGILGERVPQLLFVIILTYQEF
jgi:hypothetical protein